MKRFKQFINEEQSTESFNSFIETTLTTNQINMKNANDFLVNEFNYGGIIYKVLFVNGSEIMNLSKDDGSPDQQAISDYIAKKMNPNRYVFFSKSLKGIENFIKYPGLFTLNESLIGVIFSIKAVASIDMTKYTGKNLEVKKRIDATQEVISFEDITINKIEGLYYFIERYGWSLETDLNQPLFEEGEEEPEEVTTDQNIEDKGNLK